MFSSVGATALPQAHPEMTLPTQRRQHSQAPLARDHPSDSPPSCVAKPPCNYANCHTTPFGGRFNALTAEPNAQHPSTPSSLFCQPPPAPPTRASNAIIPVHARPPHTPLPKLGIVLTRRPSSLRFFLRTRWFAVARFSSTKPVGPAIAARKSRPNPRTCSDGRHTARAGGCGVGGVGVYGRQGSRGRAGWWRVEEAGGCAGRAGCEAAPHNGQRRAQNVGIYGRGRSRGKRRRECAHAERRDRGSSAGR